MQERSVHYDRQTVDNPNPFVRYVHRARMARSLKLTEQYLPGSGTFVDFGAGTGLLLHQVRHRNANADLIGIEPFKAPLHPEAARYVDSLADIATAGADLISAFEVCEHMYEPEIREFLGQCRRVLRPRGRLLVSVPIMYGMTVVPKVLNRILLYRRNNTGYRLHDLLNSTLGIPISRPDNPRHTHAGFDFRWLLRLIGEEFAIRRVIHSPFAALPWYMNSQIFVVCEKAPSAS